MNYMDGANLIRGFGYIYVNIRLIAKSGFNFGYN